jgi:hypothetical protein
MPKFVQEALFQEMIVLDAYFSKFFNIFVDLNIGNLFLYDFLHESIVCM